MASNSSLVAPRLGCGSPVWVRYDFTYLDFAVAALTNTIVVATLLPKTIVHNCIIKHDTSFKDAGSITQYHISVGITGNLAQISASLNVFQAPSETAYGTIMTSAQDIPLSFSLSVPIQVTATAKGANLNTATQGSLSIWLELSNLI